MRPSRSLICVVSLPSEKVPAPPSPNCTLETGSKEPLFQKPYTSRTRSRAGLPRSTSSGRKPARASMSPASRPQGPAPTITGRVKPFRGARAGNS